MPVCCVPGCDNRYTPNGLAFHHLPQGLRNEERRKLWEKNIGRALTPKSVVCERHFTPDQFEQNRKDGKRPLRWNAIPTIFSMKRLNKPKRIHEMKQENPSTAMPFQTIGAINMSGMDEHIITSENSQQINLVQQVMIPFDKKHLAQIIKDTTPGCIPILPKFDPSSYVSVKKTEIDEYKKDISKYKFLAETCTNKVNSLISILKKLSKDKSKSNSNLKHVFNDDQIKCLFSIDSNDEINWGYKTIEKAIELYTACGEEGYKVIISQKLPYPSLELLKKLKPDLFNSNISNHEHFNM